MLFNKSYSQKVSTAPVLFCPGYTVDLSIMLLKARCRYDFRNGHISYNGRRIFEICFCEVPCMSERIARIKSDNKVSSCWATSGCIDKSFIDSLFDYTNQGIATLCPKFLGDSIDTFRSVVVVLLSTSHLSSKVV